MINSDKASGVVSPGSIGQQTYLEKQHLHVVLFLSYPLTTSSNKKPVLFTPGSVGMIREATPMTSRRLWGDVGADALKDLAAVPRPQVKC